MSDKKSAIDVAFLRSVIEDDREFERELFAIFTENAQRNLVKMDEAMKAPDNNAWYMASHAFKGAAASIGAFELSKTLEKAQTHPEDSLEEKTVILTKVKEEFSRVLEFINQELLDK
jgi:HPt (histidine-containing phosphotransfer) domain-containing protein